MKNKLFIILVSFIVLLSACSDHSKSDDYSKERGSESSESIDERGKKFIEKFSDTYPDFELLEYTLGAVESFPIQLVAIAQNKKTGSSSTLFVLDNNGVGQIVLASEYQAIYRKEDELRLEKNAITVSLDVLISDTKSEIHDFTITVTQEENQGKINTVYSSQEMIRNN